MTAFAQLTTLGVGGPITDLVTAEHEADVVEAVSPDAFVLGGGSNLVVGDAPFEPEWCAAGRLAFYLSADRIFG